jgi:small subunit ribosomal protein S17
MAEETKTEKTAGQRKVLVGQVVSTKMTKTIVVEVHRQKAHPLYRRVVKRTKKFYAHDEVETARTGDFVRIEETRPLSRLKRWTLKEIVKRSALATAAIAAETAAAAKGTPEPTS